MLGALLELPDVQNRKSEIRVPLRRVGVSSVKMPIGYLSYGDEPVVIIPTFDAYIDLPIGQRGINASRNFEVIMDVLREESGKRYKLEEVVARIARGLLKRHEYATKSEVKANGEIFVEKTTPKTKVNTFEPYEIVATARAQRIANRSIRVQKSVGVRATGITACPCAQEVLKEISIRDLREQTSVKLKDILEVLDHLPLGSHMQRTTSFLSVEIPNGFDLDARDLVGIVEASMSGVTYGLLKRADEADVVKEALLKPRFAEDCVRYVTQNFATRYTNLPGNVTIHVITRSLESIHKHDFVAEVTTTLREVRQQLKLR